MEQHYDVVIIGAGPSGCSAAIFLAKNTDLKILLVDKETFPREKVCGDGLVGDSPRCLKELGLWDKIKNTGHSTSKIVFYPFTDNRSFSFDADIVLLKRKILDNIMFNETLAHKNVSYLHASFQGKISRKQNGSTIYLKGVLSKEEITISSKFVIFSFGCQSNKGIYSTLSVPYRKPDSIFIRGYYKADWKITDPTILFLGHSVKGYIWVFPIGNQIFNVGCGIANFGKAKYRIRELFYENIEKLDLKYNTKGNWESDPPRGAIIYWGLRKFRKFSKENILFAGETISSSYPFTGEGIGKAMETGIIAAKSIIESVKGNTDNPAAIYNRMIKDLSKFYKPYWLAALVGIFSPLYNKYFEHVIKNPSESKRISDILSEKAQFPTKYYILKRLLKLIFRKH